MGWLLTARDIAAICASLTVIYGVNAWRRDFVGKRKIEMAEETLGLFFRASDAVRSMRSPMAYSNESEHIIKNDHETDARFHARRTVAPLYKRYEQNAELFSSIRAFRYQFMARFGTNAVKPFEDLHMLINEILSSGNMLILLAESRDEACNSEQREKSIEDRRKHESVIWDHGLDDPINARLKGIINSIEATCRPVIDTTPIWKKLCGKIM